VPSEEPHTTRYDVFGNRRSATFGNRLTSTWEYDYDRLRLSRFSAEYTADPTRYQDLTYTYYYLLRSVMARARGDPAQIAPRLYKRHDDREQLSPVFFAEPTVPMRFGAPWAPELA
jgi:hypothetical protein